MIPREQKIEQSVQERIKSIVFSDSDYKPSKIEILDAFDAKKFEGAVDKNYIALGFNFDNGGRQGEAGSTLIFRQHTIEVWIVPATPIWGRNLSALVKDALEADLRIPLLDVAQASKPIIDYLIVDEVQRERAVIPNPRPWQEFIWIVRLRVTDEYYART